MEKNGKIYENSLKNSGFYAYLVSATNEVWAQLASSELATTFCSFVPPAVVVSNAHAFVFVEINNKNAEENNRRHRIIWTAKMAENCEKLGN